MFGQEDLVVEAEVADVRPTEGIDHEVVAMPGEVLTQIGVHAQSFTIPSQHPSIEHRRHEEITVGQPSKAGGL